MEQDPPWLVLLAQRIGTPTKTGSVPTDFVKEIFKHTNYPELTTYTPPSCAATANWALEKCGFKGTGRADAISFLNYGKASPLVHGAICLFQWPNGDHHVTFFRNEHLSKDYGVFLGGNQHGQISTGVYHFTNIISIRWPETTRGRG